MNRIQASKSHRVNACKAVAALTLFLFLTAECVSPAFAHQIASQQVALSTGPTVPTNQEGDVVLNSQLNAPQNSSTDFLSEPATLSEPTVTPTIQPLSHDPVNPADQTDRGDAPSNSTFRFFEADNNGVKEVYVENKSTGAQHFITALEAGQTAKALDVDPAGNYALVNVTGPDMEKKGLVLIYNIPNNTLVNGVDPNGASLGPVYGEVIAGPNPTTPYHFEKGLVFFNTQEGDFASCGFQCFTYSPRRRGNVLNLNVFPPRLSQTGLGGGSVDTNFTIPLDKIHFTPQMDAVVWTTGNVQRSNPLAHIYLVATGQLQQQYLGTYGRGNDVRAISPDGNFAVIDGTTGFYAVWARDITQTRARALPYTIFREGVVNKAEFVSGTIAEVTFSNGKIIYLEVTPTVFRVITPTSASRVLAPSNPNFAFEIVRLNGVDLIYLENLTTQVKKRIGLRTYSGSQYASIIQHLDVNPTGRLAFYTRTDADRYVGFYGTFVYDIQKDLIVGQYFGAAYADKQGDRAYRFFDNGLVTVFNVHQPPVIRPTNHNDEGVVIDLISGDPVIKSYPVQTQLPGPILLDTVTVTPAVITFNTKHAGVQVIQRVPSVPAPVPPAPAPSTPASVVTALETFYGSPDLAGAVIQDVRTVETGGVLRAAQVTLTEADGTDAVLQVRNRRGNLTVDRLCEYDDQAELESCSRIRYDTDGKVRMIRRNGPDRESHSRLNVRSRDGATEYQLKISGVRNRIALNGDGLSAFELVQLMKQAES